MLLKEFFDKSLRILNEAKVDDLIAKHPEHEEAIRAYHDADPTPTKKFLPWLVKQHVAGNVTPNDARLKSTLQNFDKVKHSLDNKDHSGYHYNDLANAVGDRTKAKLEQESKKKAVETVHSDPKTGITAQEIKTKEASQNLYGGGAERGGKKGCARGTNWCVSARVDGAAHMYGRYGNMYTIHVPHDDNAPYAVHPFHNGGTITSRHNDGEKPFNEVVNNNPHISNAANAIMRHSSNHIDTLLSSKDETIRQNAISHPNATSEHISKALNDKNKFVRAAAISHPNATSEHISKALNDEDSFVRRTALRHPSVTLEHINKGLNDRDEGVRTLASNIQKSLSKDK